MPNLWKFISKAQPDAPKIENYQFVAAEDLNFDIEEEPVPEAEPLEAPDSAMDAELDDAEEDAAELLEDGAGCDASNPVSYAHIQSDLILQDAKAQAEEIIRQAEEKAQQEIEEARQQAKEEGYQVGFQEGIQQGSAQALEEGRRSKEAFVQQMGDEVEAFLERAETALDKQLDDNVDEMRDLAIAVAEKVISVSLKSSSEVIGRMIQMAVDKRKRREWAHIYIAECDAKRLTSLSPALSTALSELSDRVRIIPMADDESGTCIIECPDEIIDSSAATQLQNIRELLNSHSGSGTMSNFGLEK